MYQFSLLIAIPVISFTLYSFKGDLYDNFHLFKNLLKNISPQIISDFILFKTRLWTSKHLEIGSLKSYKKEYELTYYEGDRKFRIRFPKNRGVRQISHVEDFDETNVTEEFLELMGPGHNFHGIPTTPRLLGWEKGLNIYYRCGTKIFYGGGDVIGLYPD